VWTDARVRDQWAKIAVRGAQSRYVVLPGLLTRRLPTFRRVQVNHVFRGFLAQPALINTDRRTYHMELRSTEKTYMASVSWVYAQDQIIALRRQDAVAEAAAPVDTGLDIGRLRFRYTIEGDNPPWRPLHAFDDGRKVYIEFPRGIAQGEMPPLFIIGADGKTSELVNYRVRNNHMIVDRLFAAAKLRLGDKGSERRVRIVRNDGGMTW
jgi:type IV secretion system protein TrbG